ncbi:MAG: ATP-binding protein [Pseudomonadota bacterium]
MKKSEVDYSVETEKALNLLRDAIESLKEGFALYDDDRRLVMFNKRYAEMNKGIADILKPGLDWEILMRETARRGIYAEAIGNEDKWVSDRLMNGVEFIQDFELLETDGRTYLVSVHPTDLGGFVVTREDITDRRQIENAEREGDLVIRTVLDASSAVVVMARIGDGQILYRSPAALELFGNTKYASQHYADPEERADFITQMLADGQVDDYRLKAIAAAGNEIDISISARFAEFKSEEVIVTSIVDLTEQLKAEAIIRKVLESYPAAINMTNAETGELLFATPEIKALFGSVDNSKSYYADPDERPRYLKELRKHGWLKDRKVEFINAKGKKFWAADSSRLIEFNGEEVIVSNTRDLTDELAIEEQLSKQREMLFQNEKMSALGELLAGVAHELNNPLSVVVGHALMMQEEITDPDLCARIKKIGKAAERCAKIVKTFLAMARQQPSRIEQVDVSAVIDTAIDVAGYSINSETIQISKLIAPNLPKIAADSDQITQVIINLILNAEHAMKTSGKGNQVQVSAKLNENGDMIKISVKDNGPGIPESIQPRIFEPFFTTKDVGEGTGIGLAFCHRIVLSHGGNISLETSGELGTKFKIGIPVADTGETKEIHYESASGKNQGLRALVIDDEVEVGELTSEILKRDGFQVDYVSSGKEAIQLIEQEDYDVVLSDLNMPEIDGRVIYEMLRNQHPHMLSRTAFITGDTMGTSSQDLLKESGLPHLEKPVAPSELRQLVAILVSGGKGDTDEQQ